MKFYIESSGSWANKILEDYPCLKNYSFEWRLDEGQPSHRRYGVVTINTLEELIKFMAECEYPLILSELLPNADNYAQFTIEIYDCYRE